MTAVHPSTLRVLIGAGSYADAASALKILKAATQERHMTLGGMMVVDQRALALCDIPNQRSVSSTGVLSRVPDPKWVTALIEADAKAFRASLAELAALVGSSWVFAQTMGDLVRDILHTQDVWDVIVFGHTKPYVAHGKIVVISAGGARNADLTHFADRLAAQNGTERVDLNMGRAQGGEPGTLHGPTFEATLALVSRMSPLAVLVEASEDLLQQADALQKLLDAARCPVLVFGADILRPDVMGPDLNPAASSPR